ncbi:MOSC domain-containing protein [Sphingosinicella soli]|uniref:MOSC domain-containing protein YiiM n=1 Tax=Sphingosinicella soli TaxID=333708 RepID=A0A7W7B1C8_9SPHN|nr:MOSC domain-containing protein [Sphingosinicella soli]MBB4631185.1 MOSC domain-containing protein YiiM [Sphingosinicella soli]
MTGLAIEAVLTGTPRLLRGDEMSAIAKKPVDGPVAVTPLGLEGDAQADTESHGGIDMAIHHYPRDHYAFWASLMPDQPLLRAAGAFGENISTTGLDENAACIGDRYRLGIALVEISQGRQPCWKPAHRLGRPLLVAEIVKTGRSGWYYRVIEPGVVAAGDTLRLEDRPLPAWTVARVFGLIVGTARKTDPAGLKAVAGLTPLSAEWRERARRLAA